MAKSTWRLQAAFDELVQHVQADNVERVKLLMQKFDRYQLSRVAPHIRSVEMIDVLQPSHWGHLQHPPLIQALVESKVQQRSIRGCSAPMLEAWLEAGYKLDEIDFLWLEPSGMMTFAVACGYDIQQLSHVSNPIERRLCYELGYQPFIPDVCGRYLTWEERVEERHHVWRAALSWMASCVW